MNEYALGNVYIREGGPLEKGQEVGGHCHHFDHVTYIARGSATIDQMEPAPALDQPPKVLRTVTKTAKEGRNWVLIKAECWHRITALEDGTIYHCIYAHRNPQGEVVQEYDGWAKGNT